MAATTFDLGDVKRRMQGAISALKHDLGSLRTRATRDGETFKITGNKTWITHAARAAARRMAALLGERVRALFSGGIRPRQGRRQQPAPGPTSAGSRAPASGIWSA